MGVDPKRTRWVVAAGSLTFLVAFTVGSYLLWDARYRFSLWVDLLWTVAAFAAATRAWLTARRHHAPHLRFAWTCFAAGSAVFGLGMLVWDWFELVEQRYWPFPTAADFLYLLVPVCYIAGFVAFRPAAPSRRVTVRQLYYLGILVCSAGMVNTFVFAAPMSQRGFDPLQTGAAILYPALAVTALVFGLITIWLDDRTPGLPLRILVAGVAVDFLARSTYPIQLLSPTKIPNYYTAPLWLSLVVCTFWAAWVEAVTPPEDAAPAHFPIRRERPRAFELTIPALAMLAVVVAGWLLRDNLTAGLWPYLVLQAVVLVALTWGLEWWNRQTLTDLLHQVRTSEGQVRSLLDSTAEGIYGLDARGRIMFANPAAAQMLGWKAPHELIGQDAHALFHHSHPDGSPYPVETCPMVQVRTEGLVLSGRDWFWDRSGRGFPIEYQATPLLRDGRSTGAVIAFTDVSNRVASEQALARSEAYFRSIVQHASDAIVLLDPALVVQFASPSTQRLTGYSPELLKGRPVLDLVHPDDRVAAAEALSRAAKEQRGAVTAIMRIRRQDGGWAVIELVGSSLEPTPAGAGVICPMRDITERLAAEVERRRLEDQLRQSQKMEAVGLLAGGIAHDFNNLLTAILGTAALLAEDLPEGSPLRNEAKEIETAAQRGASLTRQLLTFSRRQAAQPRAVELNSLLTQMSHLLRRLLGEEIRLVTHLERSGVWVLADPGHLEQVVMNLAVNSRDAMPRGGTLTIRTGHTRTLIGADSQASVLLTVEDTGIGMGPEVQARAFEPFFTTKELGRGTGLGLATVYGIVQQAGGSIELESSPGHGTTVRVRLPATRPEDSSDQNAEAPSMARGSETILLVEDEAPVRAVAQRTLSSAGYRVLEASEASEARRLATVHHESIALLVTDVVMPGLRGPDLAAELSTTLPGLRVLFISGYSPDDLVRREDRPGYGFMQKPFTPESLRLKVRELLNGPPGSLQPRTSAPRQTIGD
ncbi:MAG TPA: PAS domain S-box protein [Gemmatimonadales bacterium]|nr:PAS domain S-box protein [Gemmatimonadales bacterium]